jgi:hypothetical protein
MDVDMAMEQDSGVITIPCKKMTLALKWTPDIDMDMDVGMDILKARTDAYTVGYWIHPTCDTNTLTIQSSRLLFLMNGPCLQHQKIVIFAVFSHYGAECVTTLKKCCST